MRCPSLLRIACSAAVLFAWHPVAAQTPAAFYEENCADCHTIGGGPLGGPDLKGVTSRRDRDWLIRFLVDTDDFASDPIVLQMIKEADGMEMAQTPDMTHQMAEALLALIEERGGTAGPGGAAAAPPPFTPEDVSRGRDLFVGRVRLSAAGPPCAVCHDAATLAPPGGGRFGPDLSRAHERLGGRRGLNAWLGSTPTPMMRALYRRTALTPDEARALTAFLEDAAATGGVRPPAWAPRFLIGGAAGAAAVLLVAGLAWARRFRGVRRALVDRANGAAASGGRP